MTSCLVPDVNKEGRKCKIDISPQARAVLNIEGEHEAANLSTLRFNKIEDKKKQGETLGDPERKLQVQATENLYLELNTYTSLKIHHA